MEIGQASKGADEISVLFVICRGS